MDSFGKKAQQPEVDVHPLEQDEERQQPSRSQHQRQQDGSSRPGGIAGQIQRWTPLVFMLSYFIFSISIYVLVPREGVKVFWFLYLTIGTLLAGTTLLEAYDGQTLLKAARKTIAKHAKSGWKEDAKLLQVELIVEEARGDGYERIRALRDTIVYPEEKLRITVLPDSGDDAALLHHLCSVQDRQSGPITEITAIFRADDTPHPHAIRHAVERLNTDKKIDMVQSRSVLAYPSNLSTFQKIYSSLAALLHDSSYGLLLPGRTVTWGLPLSHGSALYSRTVPLQNAARVLYARASTRHNGPALALSALSQNVKAAYDLSVVTYTSCPPTILGCLRLHIRATAQWAACLPFLRLVFTKTQQPASKAEDGADAKRATKTFKQRLALLFSLLLTRLCAHAVLQYLALSLALLFTSAPASAAEFSKLIFFPYTISIWLIASGLVCLVGTVAMVHRAGSEFAPPGWAFPGLVVVWPVVLLGSAVADVWVQVGVVVGCL